ncbi:Protein of unknown function (DUF2911) [Pontibacter ummariensis]|uniref:DUF2911 domain-containing protein n=1 Tax=Pontibacter ummariensis TaxID=1610492 RepID=A0A239IJS3_9BACT|nr:DUF2911 domain-containing protein [Pontibacter ummariensis]PRY09875.1 Protein of unknown function (DUF2911) [Pontibacter ummariensis]SNS93662.1 Protein of unknown function [Pontibacter ummariensis]
MKNTKGLRLLTLLLLGVLISASAWAQDSKANRASPPATATGKVGPATVVVNYSSPAVNGREIWGDLVRYGEVWRSGANEATTVEVDQDVLVEGQRLPAGRYSFYTIPGEDEWTVIFNKVADQWGTQYDQQQDALRVTAKPQKSTAMNERLKYDVTNDGIVLLWENLMLPVSIKPAQ